MGECKANLKAWYTAERAFFYEKERYSTSVAEIGFRPERGNRYLYLDDVRVAFTDRSTEKDVGTPRDTGFQPDLYKFGPDVGIPIRDLPSRLAGGVPLGMKGKCPDCEITALCMGQLDKDPTYDLWSISTEKRIAPDGAEIPEGQPYLEINDVQD